MIANTVEIVVAVVFGLAFVAMFSIIVLCGIAEFKVTDESLTSDDGAESRV